MSSNPRAVSKETGDFLYEAFYSGAIGGSAVALFFLVVDTLNGEPFFTPSLMGSVLFGGAAAEAVTGVRLDMVAYYSLVHFASFGALGAGIALLLREAELHTRHPMLVILLFFVIFEIGFAVAASLFLSGVMARLGIGRVTAANLLAASAMALFLLTSHRPDLWRKLRRAAHQP